MKPQKLFHTSDCLPAAALTRRSFLSASLKTGALLLAPAFVPASVLGRNGAVGPNERVHSARLASAIAAAMFWVASSRKRMFSFSPFAT